MPLYAFTNSNPTHQHLCAKDYAETLSCFRKVFVSFELGKRKPESEALEAIAAAIGVHLDRIPFFDDTLENVESARAIGVQAVHVRSVADVENTIAGLSMKQSNPKTRVTHPTPYPGVNAVLHVLLSSVQTILGDHFVGMYLYGSLASGDFDQASDIDVVVVTDDEISGDLFTVLQAMHARINVGDSPWAIQLEVSYIPLPALRRYHPNQALHPHIDRGRGESLRMMQHDSDWIIQRHMLREQGLVVTGLALRTLIDPVLPNELRRAVLEALHGWWAPILGDPARLNSRGYQSYAVLTMCRMLYTLHYGTVVSKPVAAHWSQETLGERWVPVIERAWAGRQNPRTKAQSEDVNGTLDFIAYALERSLQFEVPTDEA